MTCRCVPTRVLRSAVKREIPSVTRELACVRVADGGPMLTDLDAIRKQSVADCPQDHALRRRNARERAVELGREGGGKGAKERANHRATRRSRTGDLLITNLARQFSADFGPGSASTAEARCVRGFPRCRYCAVVGGVRSHSAELAHKRHTKSGAGAGPPKSGRAGRKEHGADGVQVRGVPAQRDGWERLPPT